MTVKELILVLEQIDNNRNLDVVFTIPGIVTHKELSEYDIDEQETDEGRAICLIVE